MLRRAHSPLLCRFATTAQAAGIALPGAPFADVTLKPFPVRAAFDIGSGGMLSLLVARVDRRNQKIRDVLHQTSLPLYQAARPSIEGGSGDGSMAMTEETWADVCAKMRIMHGVLKRDYGVVERAAVVTAPLCQTANARQLAAHLTKEFKVKVRLLQDDVRDRRLAALQRSRRSLRDASEETAVTTVADDDTAADQDAGDLSEAMALLAFEAYAAQTVTANRHRLVVVVEEPRTGALSLVGSQLAAGRAVDTASQDDEDALQATPLATLRHHHLQLGSETAHRVLIALAQRRPYLAPTQSPNPVTPAEFTRLVGHLEAILKATVPKWVLEKLSAGGVLCGTSQNGGLLNTAARVAGHVVVTVDRIEVAAMYHYCQLTDTLLAETYPNPHWVVPQAALASALLRAVCAPQVEYVPAVTLAAGILFNETYWASPARLAVLRRQRFFASAKARSFEKPKRIEDKSAPLGRSAREVYALDQASSHLKG